MSSPILRDGPFSGYRVTLAPAAASIILVAFATQYPALADLLAGRQPDQLTAREAAALFDVVAIAAREQGVPVPLRFIPVRCGRSHALSFEAIALSATEILHLVHDGFFGSVRCREAAIAAVQACGALPVPPIGLSPLSRRASPTAAEHHVDQLIEREAELRHRPAADPRRRLSP